MEAALRAVGISKRFGPTLALQGVDFVAEPGEIHALVGENGAGKSTLMNLIAGRIRPDRGEITLAGRSLRPGSAKAALAAGIALVHQSPLLFERFTVADNLVAGALWRGGRAARAAAAAAARTATELDFQLPLDGTLIETLSVAARVRLEILRALSLEPRVLILDEPTSLLGPHELAGFLDLMRKLRGGGRIVILITHKLPEALAVADRITVLRAGRVVMLARPAEISEARLAAAMVGEIEPVRQPQDAPASSGQEVLRVESLSLTLAGRAALKGVSVRLNSGEILGVAGVDGNGQRELVETLAGLHRPTAGRILLNGRPLPAGGCEEIAVLPQNRDLDGLILDFPLWENLLLAGVLRRRARRRGLLDRSWVMELCQSLIERFQIRAPGPRLPALALSGGHRQRLMVARAVATAPKVLVAHDLTRGLDVAAAAAVHRAIGDFAAHVGAVLLFSTDLDEVLNCCHRVAVLSRGTLTEVAPHERYPERLGLLMAGATS